jgi:signal transduction histidine kinase
LTHSILKPNGTSSLRYVRIIIKDDGPGISPEIEARLFEPYCTTKGNSHSGMGLSVVSSLIRDLGGSVTSSSTVGQGAAFTILLPVDSV